MGKWDQTKFERKSTFLILAYGSYGPPTYISAFRPIYRIGLVGLSAGQ